MQNLLNRIIVDPKLLPSRLFSKLGIFKSFSHLERIVLYVNTVCNAKCSYCDIGIGNGLGIARVDRNSFMTTEVLMRILHDDSIVGKKMSFNLLMTEPLLSKNISEIVKLIKEYGHSVLLTTNGFLLKKKAFDLVEAGVDKIQVSLDGTSEIHNKSRGLVGSYERALDGINEIKKLSNIHVRVNTTITPYNQDCLVDIANDLDSNVVIDRLKFQLMNFVSSEMSVSQNKNTSIQQTISSVTESNLLNKIDSNVLLDQFTKLRLTKYDNIGELLFIPSFTDTYAIDDWFNPLGQPVVENNKCFLPYKQIAIKPNGDVTWHMRCFDYVIGNMFLSSLDKIFYQSNSANEFRMEHRRNNFCMPACTRCCGVTTSGA
jgi:Fe-coproporphyrin III synthase